MSDYYAEDIIRSYRWLGHSRHEFTELNAFHRNYRPGPDNYQFNRRHGFNTKIWYVNSEQQLMEFVRRFYRNHTLCFGVNPRPKRFRNNAGYLRSAQNVDILFIQNLYLDFDLENPGKDENFFRLEELLDDIEFFLSKENIQKPVRAFTGNGYHLLFAIPKVSAEEYPDFGMKLKKFRDIIAYEFGDSMKSEGIRLDSTVEPRRVAKIYGTKKPADTARLSRFFGCERTEDFVLKEYLLSLEPDVEKPAADISVPKKLPEEFRGLLERDLLIRKLWNNEGKLKTLDGSRSGYDFSLVKACLKKGITDIKALSAIIILRPEGAFQKSGKNLSYVKRTIANAIMK